jgi:hypothetical protein
VSDHEDPGWRAAIRGIGWFVFPIVHFWKARKKPGEDGLISLRRVHLGLVDSLFLFFVAFAFIAPAWSRDVVVRLSTAHCRN